MVSPNSFLNPLVVSADAVPDVAVAASRAQSTAQEFMTGLKRGLVREGAKEFMYLVVPDPFGRYGLLGSAVGSAIDKAVPVPQLDAQPGPLGNGGLFGGVAGGVAGGISKLGDDANKLATKALIGEGIFIAGVVAIAGIAAWYLSKSEDARTATKGAAKALLLTAAR